MIWEKMKCPYCGGIWELTVKQVAFNTRFKCPHCRKYNWGSVSGTDEGILIGVTRAELEELEKEDF